MEPSEDLGIKSEFNMGKATLERIHKLFSYINEAPHHPVYSLLFTPERKCDAYLSTYEEVYALISPEERAFFAEKVKEILLSQREFVLAKAGEDRISELRAIKSASKLNLLLMEFGKELRASLQNHGLLYKGEESKDSVVDFNSKKDIFLNKKNARRSY